MWERWKVWLHRSSPSSPWDEHISAEVHRRSLESIQKVTTAFGHCVNAFLLSVFITLVGGAPLRLSEIQVWVIVAACPCLVIVRMMPTWLNRHTVHLWYGALLIGFSVFIATSTTISAERVWNHSNMLLPLRMLLSINYSNLPMILVFNSVYSTAATYSVANALNADDAVMIEGDVRLRIVVAFEIIWLIGLMYLSETFTASLRQEIVHQLRATCLQGEGTAMMHLLDAMCDVVVELDGEKRLVENSKSFTAMFALNPASDSRGSQLQDLMPLAEDRKAVDELLCAMSSNAEQVLPRIAHVTLCDSYGMRFKAELFLVHFKGLNLSSRFYVGIQESREVRVAALQQDRHGSHGGQAEEDAASLGSNVSDAASAGDSPPCKPLLHPHFKRTKQDAEVLSLMVAMVTWNFVVPPRRCCTYHAALDEVLRIVKPLMEGPCNSAFKPHFSAQCSECGILDDWNSESDSLQCSHCRQGNMTRDSRWSSL
eukprot:TRINITY_DN24474_c0_g1_i1.p1 TRINITY_DN24474_c0_g1~~TRINITY_DN24474_c0_g1_i1.p1  ORF type:complete len:550 (+),score=31.56 TRINITY_DN24474_c0_g1_i1:199-1650(+)